MLRLCSESLRSYMMRFFYLILLCFALTDCVKNPSCPATRTLLYGVCTALLSAISVRGSLGGNRCPYFRISMYPILKMRLT